MKRVPPKKFVNCKGVIYRRRRLIIVVLAAILLIGLAGIFRFVTGETVFRPFLSENGVAEIQVSPGFEVQLFAEGLCRPRFIAFGPDGVLNVSDDKGGFVYRIHYVGYLVDRLID